MKLYQFLFSFFFITGLVNASEPANNCGQNFKSSYKSNEKPKKRFDSPPKHLTQGKVLDREKKKISKSGPSVIG